MEKLLKLGLVLLLSVFISCGGGNVKKESKAIEATDTAKVTAGTKGYTFPKPDKWDTEKIDFPIDFAPSIPYRGTEDLRFAPGWASTGSDEHWAYSFLWWLEGNPSIDEEVMAENLKIYYTGLVGRNIKAKNIPQNKITPITTSVEKVSTAPRDLETYQGKITITDYNNVLFSPIILNCVIHKKQCGDRLVVLCLISPKEPGHAVWKALNGLEEGFKCGE